MEYKNGPNLEHHVVYRTAEIVITYLVDSYSALILRFGKIVVIAPTAVLGNKSYDTLIDTLFLIKLDRIFNHQE